MSQPATEQRACADCGAEDELYFHDADEVWVCEEPSFCIENQRDQARAEVARLRKALVEIERGEPLKRYAWCRAIARVALSTDLGAVMTPEDHGQATDDSTRRVEIAARALYRHFMDEDYDEFPWDDENEPSSETVEEARALAEIAVQALADEYKADDERFARAVDDAARERLQQLVMALEAS